MEVIIENPAQTPFYALSAGDVFYSKLPTVKHDSGYFMKLAQNKSDFDAVDVRSGALVYFSSTELVIPVNAELVVKR